MLTTREPAVLVLEDGRTFTGRAYGARGATFGEAVFSTGMTGYQETLTDPSYHRPGRRHDRAARRQHRHQRRGPRVAPDLGRRLRRARPRRCVPSNWRSRRSLDDELDAQGVVGISGIDTRALTRHLRERGAMRVGIFSGRCRERAARAAARPGHRLAADGRARRWPSEVATDDGLRRAGGGRAAASPSPCVDLGIKATTPQMMAERGIEVHVLPADATIDDVLRDRARRRLLLQRPRRPGDRERAGRAAARGARATALPVLRHLLRQPAARPGARLRHLQAEVRPPRHQPAGAWTAPPARSRSPRTTTASPSTRRSTATPTTAGYGTRRGQPRLPQRRRRRGPRRASTSRRFSVQYHPEAAAGPHDADYLFDRFVDLMRRDREGGDA